MVKDFNNLTLDEKDQLIREYSVHLHTTVVDTTNNRYLYFLHSLCGQYIEVIYCCTRVKLIAIRAVNYDQLNKHLKNITVHV